MPDRTIIATDSDIRKAIDMDRAISIVRSAFRNHGLSRVVMPPKIYLHLNKYRGDFRAMPAYISGDEACGLKWVNVHPLNSRRGLPTVMAVIILSDPATGACLAIMDGTHITNMRTGAAGGIAASYLAKRGSSRVGIHGCGVQARYQLEALSRFFRIRILDLYDEDRERVASLGRFARLIGVEARCAGSAKECVLGKDIVVTTTPSRRPVIKAQWISPGTHINAIGADAKGKEELDPSILKKAMIVVDDICQAIHSGEVNVPISKRLISPSDIHATLGQVITRKRSARASEREITVFDSTGLAIQDIAVAHYIYRRLSVLGRARGVKLS